MMRSWLCVASAGRAHLCRLSRLLRLLHCWRDGIAWHVGGRHGAAKGGSLCQGCPILAARHVAGRGWRAPFCCTSCCSGADCRQRRGCSHRSGRSWRRGLIRGCYKAAGWRVKGCPSWREAQPRRRGSQQRGVGFCPCCRSKGCCLCCCCHRAAAMVTSIVCSALRLVSLCTSAGRPQRVSCFCASAWCRISCRCSCSCWCCALPCLWHKRGVCLCAAP